MEPTRRDFQSSQSALAIPAYTIPAIQATTKAVQTAESTANKTLLMLTNKIRDGLLEQQALEQEKKKLLDEATRIARAHVAALCNLDIRAIELEKSELQPALAKQEATDKEISRFQNAAANHTHGPIGHVRKLWRDGHFTTYFVNKT